VSGRMIVKETAVLESIKAPSSSSDWCNLPSKAPPGRLMNS
jgi:hypothetical protein